MTDLHTRLVEAITARLNLAVTAQRPFDDDAIVMSVWEDGFVAVRAKLESEIERHCRADLERLNDHKPHGTRCTHEGIDLDGFWQEWPCPEVRRIAGVYGVNLDEQEAEARW